MGFKCGIVGLPNVGKSTLFNALTSSQAAEAANYPFCTIEPNVGKVAVPDERINKLAAIAGSAKIIPNQIEFVDIAGLVRGASKGEGLGNQFLSHIREVDAIVNVLRCFDDDDITHVEGKVDPVSDIEIIETELILADLESLEKRLPNLEKKARTDKELALDVELINQVTKVLGSSKPARLALTKDNEKRLKNLQLLTSKPVMYVCNVAEDDVLSGNKYSEQVLNKAKAEGAFCVLVSAKIEADIANLESEEEKKEFLESLNMKETGLSQVIKAGYDMLGLITFFTIGPKEAHAWTIINGTLAPQAAGVIHTDFEKGFIRSETTSYEDYIKYNGENGAREAGRLRLEGKDYKVNDGDILHFRFNV
ncbi:redox-regulated ATPase YchF [Holosporaceae bacterium 'Namur']|nr:redox-regulated ATPase YchF [Holosporaceae bacterium 'Namur']